MNHVHRAGTIVIAEAARLVPERRVLKMPRERMFAAARSFCLWIVVYVSFVPVKYQIGSCAIRTVTTGTAWARPRVRELTNWTTAIYVVQLGTLKGSMTIVVALRMAISVSLALRVIIVATRLSFGPPSSGLLVVRWQNGKMEIFVLLALHVSSVQTLPLIGTPNGPMPVAQSRAGPMEHFAWPVHLARDVQTMRPGGGGC